MNLSECLQKIHILVEGNTNYPGTSEDSYLTRLQRVQIAVQNWENEEGVLWNELFVSLADASDGDKTASDGTAEYSAPTDFKFPLGYLRLVDSSSNSTYYKLVKPGDVQLYDNSDAKIWYVTGNASTGYTIHIKPTPGSTEDGYTIQYEYYKAATIPSDPTDVLEMSDPLYVVYWAAAEELKEENPALADYYTQVALNKLNAMKLRNDVPTWWEEQGMQDVYSGFGS